MTRIIERRSSPPLSGKASVMGSVKIRTRRYNSGQIAEAVIALMVLEKIPGKGAPLP